MIKQLFHGSREIIEKPIYGAGRPNNDYGIGFYCTENLDLAKEWAVDTRRNGFANKYTLDCTGLKILNLNDDNYCALHWLALLLKHRDFDMPGPLAFEAREYIFNNFFIPIDKYDAIIGYRADDSYFRFAQDFLSGSISYEQLCRALLLGNLGQQFVLKSRRVFNLLDFQGYEVASYEQWYERKNQRDQEARREYLDNERNRRKPGELFVTSLIDNKIKPGNDVLNINVS